MKRLHQLVPVIAFAVCVGCGRSHVDVKPDNAMMVGTWTPDKDGSSLPSMLILESTTLQIRQDGTFVAEDFPRGVSLGRQSSVEGKWSVRSEGDRWVLDLPWETPTMSMLDGAQLITRNGEVLIEFRIGDPDDYSRLVLHKRGASGPTQ